VERVKESYAVVWDAGGVERAGRLEPHEEGFELYARGRSLALPFQALRSVAIERAAGERLRGLPVLSCVLADGVRVRIASLEGAGVLQELADSAAGAGLAAA
jgi:hypothetical protein